MPTPLSPMSQASTAVFDEKAQAQRRAVAVAPAVAEHPVTAGEVAAPWRGASLSDSPIAYFRRHRITAPMLEWLDFFESDVDKRLLKSPRLVKFGTHVASDRAARERYAWQKLFSWRKHDSGQGYRMRDAYGRVNNRVDKDERYISSFDGALKELVVQCTDDVFEQKNNAPWMRTRMRDLSPFALRVAGWCAWNVEHPGISQERRLVRRIVGFILLFTPVSGYVCRSGTLVTGTDSVGLAGRGERAYGGIQGVLLLTPRVREDVAE
jgi:hypothetical protein